MTEHIVFTGPGQSGKTTAANMMAKSLRSHGKTVHQDSFGGPVLDYLMLLGAVRSRTDIDKPIPLIRNSTTRMFIMREMQHMRFSYGPSILGDLLKVRCGMPHFIIIDDCSSILDARALGNYTLITVERSPVERVFPFAVSGPSLLLHNNGTLDDLERKVEKITWGGYSNVESR